MKRKWTPFINHQSAFINPSKLWLACDLLCSSPSEINARSRAAGGIQVQHGRRSALMSHPHSSGFPKSTRLIILGFAATALVLSGCSSDDLSSSHGSASARNGSDERAWNTSSSAVSASQVTHAPEQDRQDGRIVMAYPTGDRNTSTLLLEQLGSDEVHLGREYRYQIRVTNLTNAPVRNVTLRAQQPDGFRVTKVGGPSTRPSDRDAADGNGQIVLTVGNLGPKESRTVDVTGIPDRAGDLDACYAVTYQPPTLCTLVHVVNPTLNVTAEGPSDVDICQDIVYHYRVSNTGTGTARDVVLQDTLPDGLATVDGRNAIAANLGDIPQGQSREVTAHLRAAHAGNFSTNAVVRGQDENTQSTTVATTVREPKLTVAVRGPDQDYVNSQLNYQVIVTNTGDAAARNAVVQVNGSDIGRVVAVNSLQSQQPEARVAAGRTSNAGGEDLGTLNPGESRTLNVVAEGNQGGSLTLVADASAACAQRVEGRATTRIMTIPALLLEAVDEADPVRVGNEVVYDIKVTNQGSGPDRNIKVIATLPDGEQFVRANGATQGNIDGQTLTFAPVPTLAPKESVTWKVVAKAVRGADVRFKVTATSDSLTNPAEKVEPTKLY
jgi:uncharacterized repeat protein (TIGR01451 family)